MQTVLFIMLPYPSHYTNSFSYANVWREKGYRVIYVGLPPQRNLVEKQKFEFCEIIYSVEHQIKSFKAFIGLFIKSIFDETNVSQRLEAWEMSIKSTKELIEQHKPYAIFIDAHLSYLYFYLYQYTNNIAILNTKLSTQKAVGIPPLNSTYIPSKSIFSKLSCTLLWAIHLSERRIRECIKSIAYLGKDRNYFLHSWVKSNNMYHLIDRNNGLFNSVKEIPRVILGHKLLEFEHRPTFNNEHYLNLPIERDETKMMSEEYINIKQQVIELKKQSNIKVIYVSFGTIASHNTSGIISFFAKLSDVAQKQKQYFFVISLVGIRANFEDISNMKILPFIPQLDFLNHVDVMITHGGMGSIKECLQAGIPMLVYPLDIKMDQPGNGARVQAKGFGLRGNIMKDSSKEIAEKLEQVIKMNYAPIVSQKEVEIDVFQKQDVA